MRGVEGAVVSARSFSIGFLTALVDEELVPFERVMHGEGWQPYDDPDAQALSDAGGISSWMKVIEGRRIIARTMAIARMGQISSAMETIAFLTRAKPNLVFLSGIAGSLWEGKIFKG